jgi:CheY-like chemotaxis protein
MDSGKAITDYDGSKNRFPRINERNSQSELILPDALDSTNNISGGEKELGESLGLLVSKIDQVMAKVLKNGAPLGIRFTALFFADCVNSLVAFSESLPPYQYDAIALSTMLDRFRGTDQLLERLSVHNNRLVVGLIRDDEKRRGEGGGGENNPTNPIIDLEIQILGACLAFFESYFISSSVLSRWRAVHLDFLRRLSSLLEPDSKISSCDDAPRKKIKTVLLVQDNPALMGRVKKTLQNEGYNVITALDSEDGLEKVRCERPELVLMDTALPGRSGLQVCREIKQSPESKTLPVIMLTNRSQDGNHFRALIHDANMYLIKPLDNAELIAAVARHI